MELVVVGHRGMLGLDVVRAARERGHRVTCLGRPTIDIADAESCDWSIGAGDVVINCAAYTDVDACESKEADAFAVNALGVANLGRAANRVGARLVQVSTDYVFAGDATLPLGESDAVAPVSAYGRTKLAGEWAAMAANRDNLVVRTAWLYGAGGACFPKSIAKVLQDRGQAQVVADQHGQPTWSFDLAQFILELVERSAPGGVYHGTATGQTTWYGFAVEVARALGMPNSVVRPTDSASLARPARRPAYSVLAHDTSLPAGAKLIGDWRARWRVAAPQVLE